jgi:hypothetical protein
MGEEARKFDHRRYRRLLAEAINEEKRWALIQLLIEERAMERLAADVAADRLAAGAGSTARRPASSRGTTPGNPRF